MATMAYTAIQTAGASKITKNAVWQKSLKLDRDFASGESVTLKIIDHGTVLMSQSFSTIQSDGSITVELTTAQIATLNNGWYDLRLYLTSNNTVFLITGNVPEKVYVGD